ncbi:MAG: hypothetical protein V4700_04755 [Pseudomonadota bacterium]
MLRFKKICFLLLLFSALAKADINTKNNYYPFLAQGFNISHYQKCQSLIRQCPSEGIFPIPSCVKRVVNENKACWQFAKLLKIVDASPTTLSAKQVKEFTILDLLYTADGQHEYYILSKGNLWNTNIDPRSLSKVIAKQYKQASFFIVNWGEPKYHTNPDGSQRFTAVFRITDGCLACPVIAWPVLTFNFTKEGRFLGARLKNFKLDSEASAINSAN